MGKSCTRIRSSLVANARQVAFFPLHCRMVEEPLNIFSNMSCSHHRVKTKPGASDCHTR